MKSRLLVAAVGVPLLLVILLVCPAIVTALTLSFLCAVGAREMLKTTGILDHARMIGYSMLFAFLVPIWSYFGSPLLPFVIGTVIFALLLFTESLLAYPHVRFESVTAALPEQHSPHSDAGSRPVPGPDPDHDPFYCGCWRIFRRKIFRKEKAGPGSVAA